MIAVTVHLLGFYPYQVAQVVVEIKLLHTVASCPWTTSRFPEGGYGVVDGQGPGIPLLGGGDGLAQPERCGLAIAFRSA